MAFSVYHQARSRNVLASGHSESQSRASEESSSTSSFSFFSAFSSARISPSPASVIAQLMSGNLPFVLLNRCHRPQAHVPRAVRVVNLAAARVEHVHVGLAHSHRSEERR